MPAGSATVHVSDSSGLRSAPALMPSRWKLQGTRHLLVIMNVTMPDGIVVGERAMRPGFEVLSISLTVTVVLAVPTGPVGGAYGAVVVGVGAVVVVGVGVGAT